MRVDRLDRVKLLILVDGIQGERECVHVLCIPSIIVGPLAGIGEGQADSYLFVARKCLLVTGASASSIAKCRALHFFSFSFSFSLFPCVWFSPGQLLLSPSSRKHASI
ncbi:hypothetical protein J3459_007385 [Metarhizium acridum]|nr:hypothetical protein J3459_007385 [Metarhizium acridum]